MHFILFPTAVAALLLSPTTVSRQASFNCEYRWSRPRMALTFEDALDSAPAMCDALQREEIATDLRSLLSTSAGARGFFVHWLTDDEYTAADKDTPPHELVDALAESPQEVADVMVMNIISPCCMSSNRG
mmetsp:Transcript_37889/g.100206  ORF Transcript_37889/g.100206 Transcript_37889/m.100206 type:complete len:130 (-) Transcript_37889:588-977(-)